MSINRIPEERVSRSAFVFANQLFASILKRDDKRTLGVTLLSLRYKLSQICLCMGANKNSKKPSSFGCFDIQPRLDHTASK